MNYKYMPGDECYFVEGSNQSITIVKVTIDFVEIHKHKDKTTHCYHITENWTRKEYERISEDMLMNKEEALKKVDNLLCDELYKEKR